VARLKSLGKGRLGEGWSKPVQGIVEGTKESVEEADCPFWSQPPLDDNLVLLGEEETLP